MKKIFALITLVIMFLSISMTADAAKMTKKIKARKKIKKITQPHKAKFKKIEVIVKAEEKHEKNLLVKIGLDGGAGIIGAGFRFPVRGLLADTSLGYGFGNGYNVLFVKAGVNRFFNENNYAGLNLNYGSYSKRVEISGVGQIGEGGSIGIGIHYGRIIVNNISTQIGYSTNLGINAELSCKIKEF